MLISSTHWWYIISKLIKILPFAENAVRRWRDDPGANRRRGVHSWCQNLAIRRWHILNLCAASMEYQRNTRHCANTRREMSISVISKHSRDREIGSRRDDGDMRAKITRPNHDEVNVAARSTGRPACIAFVENRCDYQKYLVAQKYIISKIDEQTKK